MHSTSILRIFSVVDIFLFYLTILLQTEVDDLFKLKGNHDDFRSPIPCRKYTHMPLPLPAGGLSHRLPLLLREFLL